MKKAQVGLPRGEVSFLSNYHPCYVCIRGKFISRLFGFYIVRIHYLDLKVSFYRKCSPFCLVSIAIAQNIINVAFNIANE